MHSIFFLITGTLLAQTVLSAPVPAAGVELSKGAKLDNLYMMWWRVSDEEPSSSTPGE